MFKKKKWMYLSLLGSVTLALAVAGVWLFNTSVANAAVMTAEDLKTMTQSTTGPGLMGEGYLAHGGPGRNGFKGGVDYQKFLAEALGISVEELEAAYEKARTAAIELAVEKELITQEQADEMLVWGEGKRVFGFRSFGRGPKGVSTDEIDEQALLADALGISVEDLQAARETANQAAIEQAVAEGIITQEQADEMQSRRELTSYLSREALLAEALGMTVEELQAAYADGKTLTDLMGERDLDAATVREKLATARDEAIAQAVADGVITQEQADELVQDKSFGFGDRVRDPMFSRGKGSRGHGSFRGHGEFDGQHPWQPDVVIGHII